MRLRIAFALLAALPMLAGPPFKTDDPAPVDLGHLEFYVFSTGQRVPGDSSGVGPAIEFNYGILPDTQFHLVVPYAYDRPEGARSNGGLGDTELGIKYRFLQETDSRPQIGVFPLVEIPTGDADKSLGAGHTQVYLPVWIQKSWGPWTTYGGYGWWRNPGGENRNWSYAGWLLQRDIGDHLTLGGEAFHTTAATRDGRASDGFNFGGQVNLGEKHHLLFSAGRNFSGQTQSYFYLGYQLTTGTFGNLGDWFRHGRRS
ncbi:MAG TPA: transporter [Holophagaceae bacterium]|nr:transporter [Holophagaceae bacterium]